MSPLSPHRPRKIAKKSQPEQPDATDFSEFLISFSLFLKLAGFLLVFKVLREQPRIIKRSYLLSICSIKRTFKSAFERTGLKGGEIVPESVSVFEVFKPS